MKQIAELLAAALLGSDLRRNKTDVNAIVKATLFLGRNKVKAKDGFWLIENFMKTRKVSLSVMDQG